MPADNIEIELVNWNIATIEQKMNLATVLLTIAILLYGVYSVPISTRCGTEEFDPERSNADRLDDSLHIAGKMMAKQILNDESVFELLFYKHMQRMAEAAMSVELATDTSREAQSLREVLLGLAREACTWVNENLEASGASGEAEGANSVNCSNMTNIAEFAKEKGAEFIVTNLLYGNVTTETLSLAAQLRPIVIDMQEYLRNANTIIKPNDTHREAWVTEYISPANRCYVCRATR